MSNPIGARNLLFGILAVQKNIISGDAFVAAMKAWSTDKQKGLAQILREQHAISENHHAVLEELVDQNLAEHGDDAGQSLQSVGLAGPARDSLEQIGDADVTADLARVPREAPPPKPPARKPESAKPAPVKAPAAATIVKPKAVATAAAPTHRSSNWPLVLGCVGVLFIAAVLGMTVLVGGGLLLVALHPAEHTDIEPIAAGKPAVENPKAAEPNPAPPPKEMPVAKTPVAPPSEPIVVKPAPEPVPEPVIVKPPEAVNKAAIEFVISLPHPAHHAVLSADGRFLAYSMSNAGSFDYREGPAFNKIMRTGFVNTATTIIPLVSSRDGKKMALTGASGDGAKIHIWNWDTHKADKSFPTVGLGERSVFSSDGRHLATHVIRMDKEAPREHWFYLHDILVGKVVNQWRLEAAPHVFGFTPESRTVFFATKADPAPRAFAVDGGVPSAIRLPKIGQPHFFARDFSRFGYVNTPTRLQMNFMDGMRVLGNVDVKNADHRVTAASFSPDNHYVLMGIEDPTQPLAGGMAMIADLKRGNTLAFIEKFGAAPDNVQLAGNGLALLQGTNLRPRLFRFPTEPVEIVAKAPADPGPGFTALFNGRDLTGWNPHKAAPGNWRVENGVLIGTTLGKISGRIVSEKPFGRDFHLRVEARLPEVGAGAVYCRCPEDSLLGYDSMITSAFPIGRLMSHEPGRGVELPLTERRMLPVGAWMTLEIIAQGERLIVKVDGQTTTDALDATALRGGHIALMVYPKGTVEFRRIEIKELAPVAVAPVPVPGPVGLGVAPFPADADFVPLFNGRDLTGWRATGPQPRDWQVVNGILTGVGPNLKMLYSPRDDYGDFHLRAEVRISDDALGSLMFRYPYGPTEIAALRSGGYCVPFNGRVNDVSKTGSLMVFEKVGLRHIPANGAIAPARQWFNLEIIAKGDSVTTKVNGQNAVAFLNMKTHLVGGRLLLEANATNRQSVLEFRKIEIKEFKAVPAPPPEGPLGPFVSLLNGKDLTGWRIDGKDGWKVADNGDLVGVGPDTALVSKRADYRNFSARMEIMATADTDGFFAFREIPDPAGKLKMKALTSRLTGDGAALRAGYAGTNGTRFESGNKQHQFPPGEWVTLEFNVKQDGIRIFANGKPTGGLNFGPDIHPPGAIGLHLAKGTLRIRKFEISAEEPIGAVIAPVLPPMPPADFVPLFNGKNIEGWQPHLKTAGNWRVDKGILIGAGEEAGILTTARADYGDFHLRMEARFIVPADAESSSIIFRSPFGRAGYELLCADGKFTGGLYVNGKDFGKPVAAKVPANVASGEWFNLDFLANGNRLLVKVNGKETTDFVDADNLFKTGHIVVRQGAGGKIEIRKMDIRPLQAAIAAPAPPPEPPPAKNGFVPLFNGKDLTGWQPHAKRPGNWRVENGVLLGAAPNGGALYSTRNDYQDFHLLAEIRINDKGFGRVFGRAAYDPTKNPFKVAGYEVLINQRPLGDKTGSLTAASLLSTKMTAARESATAPGEWFMLEMLAKGDQITVKVNGVVVSEFQDAKRQFPRAGHIALHQDANAVIEFRRVEIDVLDRP